MPSREVICVLTPIKSNQSLPRCVNTDPGFYCICEPGFIPTQDRQSCLDGRQGSCFTLVARDGQCRGKMPFQVRASTYLSLVHPRQICFTKNPSCRGWTAAAARLWAKVGPLVRPTTVRLVRLQGPRSTDCFARRLQ